MLESLGANCLSCNFKTTQSCCVYFAWWFLDSNMGWRPLLLRSKCTVLMKHVNTCGFKATVSWYIGIMNRLIPCSSCIISFLLVYLNNWIQWVYKQVQLSTIYHILLILTEFSLVSLCIAWKKLLVTFVFAYFLIYWHFWNILFMLLALY